MTLVTYLPWHDYLSTNVLSNVLCMATIATNIGYQKKRKATEKTLLIEVPRYCGNSVVIRSDYIFFLIFRNKTLRFSLCIKSTIHIIELGTSSFTLSYLRYQLSYQIEKIRSKYR